MSRESFPIIRIEVERLQHSVMAALGPALEAEKEQIEKVVRKTIEDYDFESEVQAIAYREIRSQVDLSVSAAVQDAFRVGGVREMFERLATHHLVETLKFVLENKR